VICPEWSRCWTVADLDGQTASDEWDVWHHSSLADAIEQAWTETGYAYEDAYEHDPEPRRFRAVTTGLVCFTVECSRCAEPWSMEHGGGRVHFTSRAEARDCIDYWTWLSDDEVRCDDCPPTEDEIREVQSRDRSPGPGQESLL
jgi:hypothetical protein